MKILFNTIGKESTQEDEWLYLYLISSYSSQYPEDKIGIIYHEGKSSFSSLKSLSNIHLLRVHHSALLNNYKEKKQIKEYIEKSNADAILTINPISSPARNKQYLILPYFHSADRIWNEKQKKQLSEAIDNSEKTIVFSDLEHRYYADLVPGKEDKITKIYLMHPPKNAPLSFNDKQPIKEKWAGGNEFFMCHPTWSKPTLINALKGFSGFKKWQQSHMKLVVSAWNERHEAEILEITKDYRFRDEISIISVADPDYTRVIAASYAFLIPEKSEAVFDFSIRALSAEIPVIIPGGSVMQEQFGNASFHFQYQNKDDITRILLESFRDEQKRSGIIRAATDMLKAADYQSFAINLRVLFSGE